MLLSRCSRLPRPCMFIPSTGTFLLRDLITIAAAMANIVEAVLLRKPDAERVCKKTGKKTSASRYRRCACQACRVRMLTMNLPYISFSHVTMTVRINLAYF